MNNKFLILANSSSAALASVPLLSIGEFRTNLIQAVQEKHCRVSSFFAMPEKNDFRLIAVLADDAAAKIYITSAMTTERYPSLTVDVPAFHWFEREIHEQYGILPEGHPWLKPIRFQKKEDGSGDKPQIGVTDYFQVKGSTVHEVAVGPVHAGVIEPGHFRFQCLGEEVMHLEIELGYQHRGVEKMLLNAPDKKTIHIMETVSGDSSIAHATAYAQLIESLDPSLVPSENARKLRAAAAELERIANHTGDLGALAGDVAFLPTASYCGRIRGDYLNTTAILCGNRFGRNFIVPGGIRQTITPENTAEILKRLDTFQVELNDALHLMFDAPSVLDRFENTGKVPYETSVQIGMVGAAARASGDAQDIRKTHPYGAYKTINTEPVVAGNGDVLSRAEIRYKEIETSHQLLRKLLAEIKETVEAVPMREPVLQSNSIAVSLTEGWRGEVCHVAITGPDGKFCRYKITDPSFHNWFGLALALRGEAVSDFPICNKSFNLSYCGHDL